VGIAFATDHIRAGFKKAEAAMATVTQSATKAIRDYAEPALAAVEDNIRDVRRAVVAGRRAVEDCAAEATTQIRRHPFMSVGTAIGVGTLLGALIGFTIGRIVRSR
jgi:ElaB/YqjD/DUF883 family membrane-anchored ribosome-binding protein